MALGVLRFCAVKRQAYAGLIRVNRNDTDINLCKFDRWDGRMDCNIRQQSCSLCRSWSIEAESKDTDLIRSVSRVVHLNICTTYVQWPRYPPC